MAKKKIKPTPAGILFLSAIAVLIIALITVMIVLISNCNKNRSNVKPDASPSATAVVAETPTIAPVVTPTVDPSLNPIDNQTPDPDTTTDPNDTTGPVINTPPASGTAEAGATATAGASYYTEPTSSMKNNSQKGYVTGDKVNMRKGPGTNYDKVKSDIAKNTAVTLYVEQNGWWFLKCGDKYGYIKKDYVAKGSAPTSAATGEVTGTVTGSTVALRKDADKSSQCIKEYSKGETVTIYYKSSDGKWYYVKVSSDGKKGWMYAEYVKANGKVGTKG